MQPSNANLGMPSSSSWGTPDMQAKARANYATRRGAPSFKIAAITNTRYPSTPANNPMGQMTARMNSGRAPRTPII